MAPASVRTSRRPCRQAAGRKARRPAVPVRGSRPCGAVCPAGANIKGMRPNRSGPALSGPGPWALAAVGVGWWLAAGPPARGRPASGLVAGRPKTGGRHPPAGGALPWWRWPGRWLRPPGRGVGGLAGARAPPAPNSTSPRRGPPSPGRRGGGGPLSGARPWFSLGWPRAAASPGFLRRPGAEKGGGIIPAALESACPGRQRNGAPPAGCGPPPPHEGGLGFGFRRLRAAGDVNGAEGCVRETRKGVLHDDDPHFSELLETLKNASAWRKDFSPRKKGIPAALPPGYPFSTKFP